MLSNILNIYCKNIFNNFLIAESGRTRTHFFQKLPSPAPAPAPAPESRNAPVFHRLVFKAKPTLPIPTIYNLNHHTKFKLKKSNSESKNIIKPSSPAFLCQIWLASRTEEDPFPS